MHKEQETKSNSNHIYGIRPVMEAIEAGKEFDKIMLQKGLNNPLISELFQMLRKNNIIFQYVPIEKLNRITRKNHQGVIAFTSLVSYTPVEEIIAGVFEKGENPFLILLDRVTDVRNLGAIARTAECVGAHAIIIPEQNTAQINSDAIKSSAGALLKIPVCRERNLKNTLNYLKSSGLVIIGASEKANNMMYDCDMTRPLALVMGSEEDGISEEYLKLCDELISIPMKGEIASLNVSVATGVITYEIIRQRG